MRERHNKMDGWFQRSAGSAAAVVFCLAGTAVSVAQAPSADGGQGIRNAMTQPGSVGSPTGTDKVRVDEHMIVDLHVNDEDLGSILQMLSLQSQRSIVTSRNVSAMVTANLYGVTFYEALDAILHVNGYGYIERGNFIYVYTLDELKEIERAQRTRAWRVVRLDYLNSVDAAEFVKPLLSDNGQIMTNGRPPQFAETGVLSADDFANESTMLIFDYEENLTEIERVLAELDTRPAQVLIEATILQTALTEANAFGIDFSVIGDMNFSDFLNLGGPLQAVDSMIGGERPLDNKGRAAVSTVGGTGGSATFKMGIVHNDVAAFIRLLDEVSDTSILSRPNLLILNRSVGRVLVGRKVGYLSTTSTDTATTQSVEFLDTGTQLVVRPFISSDGMIRMELMPKVSEAVIRNATTAGGQAVTIPDEISNELTTTVLVRDGQTIVLGGLFRESTQATRRQIPFAGDLPIIGAAFRGHDDDVQRSEVIFMITPTVMADNVLLEQGRRAEAAVEQVRAGSRQGLLLFSRERRTQQMLVQARELAAEGRREEALYRVNRALRLNPNQPDAIAMRETLMQERTIWPNRSMQHEIITGEIQRLGQREAASAHQADWFETPAPGQQLTVDVDAGDGIAWFEDEPAEPFEQPEENNEPPPTEQAIVPEGPISSATPVESPLPEAKQPTQTPAQQPGQQTTFLDQFPVEETPAAQQTQSEPAQAARVRPEQQPPASQTAPQQSQPSTTVASGQPLKDQQPEVQKPRQSVAEQLAAASRARQAAEAEQKPQHTTLRANTATGSQSDQSQSPVWSSALAAALEESGDLSVLANQQPTEPRWDVPEGIDPTGWDGQVQQADQSPAPESVLSIFGQFQTVWDLFEAYASQGPKPDARVTTVPTQSGN